MRSSVNLSAGEGDSCTGNVAPKPERRHAGR